MRECQGVSRAAREEPARRVRGQSDGASDVGDAVDDPPNGWAGSQDTEIDLRREDAASAKSLKGRPILARALADLKAGRADVLVVSSSTDSPAPSLTSPGSWRTPSIRAGRSSVSTSALTHERSLVERWLMWWQRSHRWSASGSANAPGKAWRRSRPRPASTWAVR